MAAMVVTANCIRDSILSVATSPLPSASSVNRYSYSNCDSVRKRRQQNIQKNSNDTNFVSTKIRKYQLVFKNHTSSPYHLTKGQ